MTYGTRKLSLVPRPQIIPPCAAHLQSAWLNACADFLHACFNGDTPERLNYLARGVFVARDAMMDARRSA